jgi:1,4-alpha-glucan branching enzyme
MTQPSNVVPLSGAAAQPPQVLSVPVASAHQVLLRLATQASRDQLEARRWTDVPMQRSSVDARFYNIDIASLGLADGTYEYLFVVDGVECADPGAVEITRFGGYRGVLHLVGGRRVSPAFDWSHELPQPLPSNNALVIYELPIHWVSRSPDSDFRQIGIGRFEDALFRVLPRLAALGVNCIELLPVQDSPDTINWGYGTRFFFAPDVDMGRPNDLKAFIKRCHQLGIRVIVDVVMNHAKECPLLELAKEWYFIDNPADEGRDNDWGGKCFRFASEAPPGQFSAREFLYEMARFWIREYHVDGFRIDEFKGIQNWDFLQEFSEVARREHSLTFPGRPFIVIGEDSARRAEVTQPIHRGKRIVDAIWDFNARDELRRLLVDDLQTSFGQPSRTERLLAVLNGWRSWDDWNHALRSGFSDMAARVAYLTSHDVEKDNEQRLMNFLLATALRERGWVDVGYLQIRNVIEGADGYRGPEARDALARAFAQARSAYALLTTTSAIPMLLAGEEFGDVHDLDHGDWRAKMSDPVDFSRAEQPGHKQLKDQVAELFALRTSHPALLRNEVSLFYAHPELDSSSGARVFAYCRTAGLALGGSGQVVVVANLGSRNYESFWLPWHWSSIGSEIAQTGTSLPVTLDGPSSQANVPLQPFQVRVFRL